jgi:hypothetical protein
MTIPLRCDCGTVGGTVDSGGITVRGSCYCRDCQAFARFLGRPERILDAGGGSEVIGTLPGRVRFTAGIERLRCVTLTRRGPYRWYADCCRTPIGNTPRTPKAAYISLLRCALAAPDLELDRAFGNADFAFSTKSATTPVHATPLGVAAAISKVVANLATARLTGRWRANPFFQPGTSEPLHAPLVLSSAQRRELRGDASDD